MPIESYWHEPGAVLYIRLYGDLKKDDLQAALNATRDAHPHIIPGQQLHTITDMTEIGKIPFKLTELIEALRGLGDVKATGWAIIISDGNPLVHFMVSTLAQLFNFRMRIFLTLEEGLNFLHEMDENLSVT